METTPSKKRKIENGQDTPSKKKKFLSLKEKLDLIKRHNDGATNSKIARDTGIPETTVRRTIKNKNEIKKQAINTTDHTLTVTTRIRSRMIVKMEELLGIWMDENIQNNIPMSKHKTKQSNLKDYFKK
jgi:predicted transcriptional regulator